MSFAPITDTLDLAPLETILDRFQGRFGALIPILQAAQAAYGYLPPEVLQFIADRLNLSLGKVYGVATFYAFFSLVPRGRHKVCVSITPGCTRMLSNTRRPRLARSFASTSAITSTLPNTLSARMTPGARLISRAMVVASPGWA
jgi:hypothetical protein